MEERPILYIRVALRRPPSDVDEETAVALLARTQECSAHFTDFSADELVTLARTLAVLHFKADETILFQGEWRTDLTNRLYGCWLHLATSYFPESCTAPCGSSRAGEPATFFAVVLEGALAPIVDGTALKDNARGVGELVGELALFHGGTRQASLVATADGVLAAFQFDELERLRASADHAACEVRTFVLARKCQVACTKEAHSYETGKTMDRPIRFPLHAAPHLRYSNFSRWCLAGWQKAEPAACACCSRQAIGSRREIARVTQRRRPSRAAGRTTPQASGTEVD